MPLNRAQVDAQRIPDGSAVRLRWQQDGRTLMQWWLVRQVHDANALVGVIEGITLRHDVSSYADLCRVIDQEHPSIPDPVFSGIVGAYSLPPDPYAFEPPPEHQGTELVWDSCLDVGWIVPVGDDQWEGRAYGGKEFGPMRDKEQLCEEIRAWARRLRGNPTI